MDGFIHFFSISYHRGLAVFDTLCVRKNTFWKQVLLCCSRASFSQISKIFWQQTPALIMSPDLLINIHSFFVG